MPFSVTRGSVAATLYGLPRGPDKPTRVVAEPPAGGAATGSASMFELYLGLAPGEEPIDRLIDDAMADPIVGDCIVSAGLPTIACEPLTDETAGHGLWHRLRARWTDASEAGLPAASRFAALSSAGRPDAFGLQVGDDKKFRASTLG